MNGPSVIIVAIVLAIAGCNPVNPLVERVDGAMYTTPGGADGGADAGDGGRGDGGKRDAAP